MSNERRVSKLGLTATLVCTFGLGGCKPAAPEQEEETLTEVAVQVGAVTRATLRAVVEAYAIVEVEPAGGGKPAGGARLAAPAAGLVMAVPVREGDTVEPGTVVVRLDDRVALPAVDKARNALAFAEQQMERQNKLNAVTGTSEKALQEAGQQLAAARADLAAAEAQLALLHLASPLAGTVVRVNVEPGQAVDPSTILAEIVDLRRLVVTADVPAAEAARIKPGQPAAVLADGGPKTGVQGQVLFISPEVEAKTATSRVRISIPPEAGLRPGQFARVRIVVEERPNRLAVPQESVYTAHDGHSTLSIVEGDTAIRKEVKVGLRDHGLVEVEGEGLKEGMAVVTIGSYALPQQTRIRVVGGRREDR